MMELRVRSLCSPPCGLVGRWYKSSAQLWSGRCCYPLIYCSCWLFEEAHCARRNRTTIRILQKENQQYIDIMISLPDSVIEAAGGKGGHGVKPIPTVVRESNPPPNLISFPHQLRLTGTL